MVYFSQLRDTLPQNCIAYLRLKSFWTKRGKCTQEILRRYLQEIGRTSTRPLKEKASYVYIVWMDVFTCKCGWLLYSPCTLPCGHTICKICFSKSKFCPFCGEESENFILNTTLDGLLEQWYPTYYKSSNLKGKAFELIKDKNFNTAIELLDEAMALVSNDFTALNLRSEAYHGLRNAKQCYSDAKRSCEISDTCAESFFRLGEAYAILNRLDDSVEAYNKCLELEPEDGDLNTKVVESLDQLLSMSPASEIAVSDDDSDHEGDKLHKLEDKPTDCTSGAKLVTILEGQKSSKDGGLNSSLEGCSQGHFSFDPSDIDKIQNSDTKAVEPSAGPEECSVSWSASCKTKKRQRELSPRVLERKRGKIDCTEVPQVDDFECKLCFCLLFQPVTTACGHVFCKKCLERCIDYNPSCPICRRKLSCMESSGVGNITRVIQDAIAHLFPEEIADRESKHRARMDLMSR